MARKQVIIDKPVINSPFEEPKRHYRISETGLTNIVIAGRRGSGHYMPFAPPKSAQPQLELEDEYTEDRFEPNEFVNRVRKRVAAWRDAGYPKVTPTTRKLLEYWRNTKREGTKRFFFCQVEALETAIYIAEVAESQGDAWLLEDLTKENADANPELFRIAFRMATGSGKTVVMAMLIAWQGLNKIKRPQDTRFSDAFLVVSPGITIRDRLQVLRPNIEGNYYRERDIVPSDLLEQLQRIKLVIINFHQFQKHSRETLGKFTKDIGGERMVRAFTESPADVVRRVCRDLGSKRNIIVFNDEAHHCYKRRVDKDAEKLTADEKDEVKRRDEAARVWIHGLEWIAKYRGIRSVYDLSATPFFLKGSGYKEGTRFGWIVSDFPLIEAMESGIVKVPRLPVTDDSMVGDLPIYRNIYVHVRDKLPRKGRRNEAITSDPILPNQLEGALKSLYDHYQKAYEKWQAETKDGEVSAPPVFIVVCNNTNVSNLIYRFIAGYQREGEEHVQAGHLELFRNDNDQGGWLAHPRTILVDSEQLESPDDIISSDFKKAAAVELATYKRQIKQQGGDPDKITDKDILREVLNTVSKPGMLGQHVRCVVSVYMLTEGWDANTVSHILGVRRFGSQLLCEQVVGRALRRRSYATTTTTVNVEGREIEIEAFPVEYAEVYGVPFNFLPTEGEGESTGPTQRPVRVRALREREKETLIRFPRVLGYRFELPPERLEASFTEKSRMVISTANQPSTTTLAPWVGEETEANLNELSNYRPQQVAFVLAKYMLEHHFRDDEGSLRHWLFPDLLRISKAWLAEYVQCHDNTCLQWLLLAELAAKAAQLIEEAVNRAIAATSEPLVKPVLPPYEQEGSTRYVDLDTLKPLFATSENKCHVSHVVCDRMDDKAKGKAWEQKVAEVLEEMNEVDRYVKNSGLEFTIPYTWIGVTRQYYPDFIAYIDDGHGLDDPLKLVIEVTGFEYEEKKRKVATAREQWIPAVNNHGGFGRWAFLEITQPANTKQLIRELISGAKPLFAGAEAEEKN